MDMCIVTEIAKKIKMQMRQVEDPKVKEGLQMALDVIRTSKVQETKQRGLSNSTSSLEDYCEFFR